MKMLAAEHETEVGRQRPGTVQKSFDERMLGRDISRTGARFSKVLTDKRAFSPVRFL